MASSERFKKTVTGHRRPDMGSAEATVFVHTTTCIYGLDHDGVCRYAVSKDGASLPKIDRCVGAQYVASLEPNTPHGLVANPNPGAHALFVGRGSGLRVALIKTPPITRVVYADDETADTKSVGSVLGWVAGEVQKSWLRSTQVGNPAVLAKGSEAAAGPASASAPSVKGPGR